MRFWAIVLYLVLHLALFSGCGGENKEGDSSQESAKKSLESAESSPKTPPKNLGDSEDSTKENNSTQNPHKSRLKKHLEELNLQLQQKNLDNLQYNQGTQEHIKHFESLYNRQDLPKQKDSTRQNPSEILEKAHRLQREQLEKLQQKNDEIW